MSETDEIDAGKRILNEIGVALIRQIDGLNREERRQALAAVEQASQTNVWWLTYQMRDIYRARLQNRERLDRISTPTPRSAE